MTARSLISGELLLCFIDQRKCQLKNVFCFVIKISACVASGGVRKGELRSIECNHHPFAAQIIFPVFHPGIYDHKVTFMNDEGIIPNEEFTGSFETEKDFPKPMRMGRAVPAIVVMEIGCVEQFSAAA